MAKNSYQLPGASATFEQNFVAAMDLWLPQVENQWKMDDADLAWLLAKKNEDYFDGGNQIVIPLEISQNPTVGWRKEGSGVSMDDYDPFDAASYWIKDLAGNVIYTKQQMRIVRGDMQRFNLLNAKIENTINTMRANLQIGMHQGAGGSSDEMDGLPNLVPATAAASQSTKVGNIDPSSYSWWRSQYASMSGKSAVSDLEDELITARDDIKAQGGNVDVHFTTQALNAIWEKIQMSYMTVAKSRIGDASFELVQALGQPIIWSPYSPAGEWRCLTSRTIKFGVDPRYWMAWTDPKPLPNVPFANVKQIVCDCNMARSSARQNKCIANIS